MYYNLILSLNFLKYKNTTNIKIYSDENFIDEIVLHESIGMRHVTLSKNEKWWWAEHKPGEKTTNRQIPKKIFVYKIAEDSLGKNIILQMSDNNSNYTNGFMTKSNMIRLFDCILCPSHILTKENLTRIARKYQTNWRHHEILYGAPPFFCNDKTPVFWPNCWWMYGQHGEILKREQWIGGSQELRLPISKKCGIHMFHNPKKSPSVTNKYTLDFNLFYYTHLFGLLNT